ncbi:MAG: FkbM family methyltransferase [Alsobacter sp.]
MTKSLAKAALGSVAQILAQAPGSLALLRKAATAPLSMKSDFFQRACGALVRGGGMGQDLFETDMGVAGLRALVPGSKPHYVFGRQANFLAERATMDLSLRLCRSAKAFVDVGANEGIFVFTIGTDRRATPGFSLHVFEPDPVIGARLKANLERNALLAEINLAAASDRDGVQTFYRNLSDDMSGSLTTDFAGAHRVTAIQTPTRALAGYLDDKDLHDAVLKIDVEGAGLAVWNGTRAAASRIDSIVMEIIGAEAENEVPRRIIEDTGWQAYYIRDFDLVPSAKGEFAYVPPFFNWLFTRRSRDALARTLEGTRFVLRA